MFPDLSGSSSSQIIMSADSLISETQEAPTIATATASAATGLRPMILASMILDSPSEPALSASTYGGERKVLGSNPEPVVFLRPLLLGKGGTAMSPPQFVGTMVPLARRRKRGGTITSNTRRPVISTPRMADDGGEAAPGAFEIPRPAPLRLD